MRICFVSQEYPEETGWGGIGTYTYEVAHGLARKGHRVFVISRALERETIYTEESNVTVHRILPRLSLNRVPFLWRLNCVWEGYHLAVAGALRSLERQVGLDVIEAPALHGETALYQYGGGNVPIVLRLHSCMPKELALNGWAWRLPLRTSHFLEKAAVKRANALTAPTQVIVEDNLPYLPIGESVHVIPNPVNIQRFQPTTSSGESLGVLFVGRFDPRKGVETLIKAMEKVWKTLPAIPFTLVGRDSPHPTEGTMKAWMKTRFTALGDVPVSFLDWVPRDQMVDVYNQAAIVVLPSLWEPFGYVCLEAMACAKPVVATRSGGPEEIIDDGITGCLVSTGDPDALAETIIEVYRSLRLRRQIGASARETVRQRFDTEVIVSRMLAIYESVVSSGQSVK